MRQLVWMADGRRIESWLQLALLRADLIAPWSDKPVDARRLLPKWIRQRLPKEEPARPSPGGVESLTRALVDDRSWAGRKGR